jgi:hypothetical protein
LLWDGDDIPGFVLIFSFCFPGIFWGSGLVKSIFGLRGRLSDKDSLDKGQKNQ